MYKVGKFEKGFGFEIENIIGRYNFLKLLVSVNF